MTQATSAATPLPCAACKQPVIEKRTLDGAVVVLDAATRRLHLCVKRKEVEAAKAKQMAASRAKAKERPAPRPPVKRAAVVAPASSARPPRPERPNREKKGRQRPRKPTRRSPEQVTELLKGNIVRWRTGDGPTSFCDRCNAPVLVGFSHVRWDVIMVDAVGHRPHDCEESRRVAATLRAQPIGPLADVPELPAVEASRAVARPLAPVTAPAPVAYAEPKPRRRAAVREEAAANRCEACGNLKASVNGEWVCLHCA